MKKKILIIAIFVIIAILTFVIPVRTGKGRWVNDSPTADVGHYMEAYYNIYGIKIWEK